MHVAGSWRVQGGAATGGWVAEGGSLTQAGSHPSQSAQLGSALAFAQVAPPDASLHCNCAGGREGVMVWGAGRMGQGGATERCPPALPGRPHGAGGHLMPTGFA